MMSRASRGFTLIELLAATALVGLITVSSLGLLSRAEAEARRAQVEQEAFERRAFALMRLRAAVGRASSATRSGDSVVLMEAGRASAWCLGEEGLGPAPGRTCLEGALRVERGVQGTLVVLVPPGGNEERMLVGGGSR